MSVIRHHAEWLSLIEVSGPFLSMPVLMRVFPQGLDPREPEKARELRLAYEEWLEKPLAPGRHQAWVQFVLTRFLEFPENLVLEKQSIPYGIEAHMAEYGEMLRPDYAIVAPPGHPAAGKPHMLLQVYLPGQNLDGPVSGKHWKASPATRMTELLHTVDIPLGMITNGEQWMLVYAPRGETSGYASWYAGIWQEEPITLRAFSSLMHTRRFFGVTAADTLQALLKESAQDQQEVTDQLGLQVRRSVEVLVQAFDRLDQESGRQLLHDIEPKELYDTALTVMMRLVFLFSAEERGMLRLGEPLYDENYAASTLREQLRETADQHGEEVLERRSDAWSRLLASFRAMYGGIAHETLRLPAYRGNLFDPDRYPFLEGRPAGTDWRRTSAEPLAVNNRVVLHLLESLQILKMKVPGGGPAEARRLSFRALDIEQIGHVYEGLLDHTAVRAATTVLGLQGAKNSEPEIPLEKLEQISAVSDEPLIEYLKEETKRSEPALRRALAERDQISINDHKLFISCSQDAQLYNRIQPFAGLLRLDSFEMPVVVLPGSVYVTEGTARRSTGTHYTPKSLTEPIVQHTLEPLIYNGPAEGWSKDKWKLKSPKEILALRVCDMTMGSGAFLVQSCRYLAERLAEAWENTEQSSPGSFIVTPDGELSAGDPAERLLPKDPDERLIIARRAIADRCLYGVDINPMAVEMAKLSLWLITMQKDRPFTFLDHALKCGDSLLGVSNLEQIDNFSLRPDVKQITFAMANLFRYVEEAANKRRQLESLPSESSYLVEKICLHAEAEVATAKVKAIADIIIALELQGLKGKAYEEARTREAEQVQWLIRKDTNSVLKKPAGDGNQISALNVYAKEPMSGRRTFHWPLEFPEIFERGGFDAFVGNPPFVGGRRLIRTFGEVYQHALQALFSSVSANADYCTYFFHRAFQTTRKSSYFGYLSTKTISEGDTRESGLEQLSAQGAMIYRAKTLIPWPGSANVLISLIYISKEGWRTNSILNEVQVPAISSFLLGISGKASAEPAQLFARMGQVFQGCAVAGDGFILEDGEARRLIEADQRNQDIVRQYITGSTFCNDYKYQPTGWIINFFDRTESEALLYPECLQIVSEKVKPYRMGVRRDAHRRYWWQFGDKRPAMFKSITGLQRVLVNARVAKYIAFDFLPGDLIYLNTLHVFPFDDGGHFALLQSSIHDVWALARISSVGVTPQYTPLDCFCTFPFPSDDRIQQINSVGKTFQDYRRQLMDGRRSGLTDIYNCFHNPNEACDDLQKLRQLHVEMNNAVATAYGWTDLDLGHGFHETKQGIRFTISEPARLIILDRLLSLNYERYEEEVKAGLHEKKAGKSAGKGRKTKSLPEKKKDQYDIFEE